MLFSFLFRWSIVHEMCYCLNESCFGNGKHTICIICYMCNIYIYIYITLFIYICRLFLWFLSMKPLRKHLGVSYSCMMKQSVSQSRHLDHTWNGPESILMIPTWSVGWLGNGPSRYSVGLTLLLLGKEWRGWSKSQGNSGNKLMWAYWLPSTSVLQDKKPCRFHGEKKSKSSILKNPWDIVLSVYLTMLGLYDFNTMVTGLERCVNGYKILATPVLQSVLRSQEYKMWQSTNLMLVPL